MTVEAFTWRDGERLIIFGADAVADAMDTLEREGWERYELFTTRRALASAPLQLPGQAFAVHEVPHGPVNEVSAGLVDAVDSPALVALGGGRVIDAAKAVAAVRGGRVAALPTTLSGAEMTGIHRLPAGHTAPRRVRPQLVLAAPGEMTTQPEPELRASAMNALAHGVDCLDTPLANPVSRMASLRGAKLIAAGLDCARDGGERAGLALGSVLCAYALDSAGLALHHVVAQTLVRTMRIPHAETNAAVLPRVIEVLRPRTPKRLTELARALGTKRDALPGRIEELAGGRRGLGSLGADEAMIDPAVDGMLDRPELQATPDPPERDELRALVASAW